MKAMSKHFPHITLRLFNNCLSIVVGILAVYIVVVPFLSEVTWWVKHDSPIKTVVTPKPSPAAVPAPQQVVAGDKLFIPRLDMATPIYGGGKGSLSKGVWRVPHTSTPDKGGNTVLVGHRFRYKDPTGAIFYHLDKIQKDDPITVHWQGKVYEYRVTDIQVVPNTQLSVEDNTKEPQLTIYTCTPLWSVTHRLVIIAKPVEVAT